MAKNTRKARAKALMRKGVELSALVEEQQNDSVRDRLLTRWRAPESKRSRYLDDPAELPKVKA